MQDIVGVINKFLLKMKERKLFWRYEGFLFYTVGYNYSISGKKVTLIRFWKWSKFARKKSIRLVRLMIKNNNFINEKKMKLHTKSEWFILDKPIAEPNEKWNTNDKYYIERIVNHEGSIIWFGCSINWKKELNGKWTELATNHDAKPLEKYLPEIVYGEDRMYWKECEIPIYEKLYLEK